MAMRLQVLTFLRRYQRRLRLESGAGVSQRSEMFGTGDSPGWSITANSLPIAARSPLTVAPPLSALARSSVPLNSLLSCARVISTRASTFAVRTC